MNKIFSIALGISIIVLTNTFLAMLCWKLQRYGFQEYGLSAVLAILSVAGLSKCYMDTSREFPELRCPLFHKKTRISMTDLLERRVSVSDENFSCPICLEEPHLDEAIVRGHLCDHEFHAHCLSSWIKHSIRQEPTCPCCRQDFRQQHHFEIVHYRSG